MNPFEIAGIAVGSIVILMGVSFAMWLFIVKKIMNIF